MSLQCVERPLPQAVRLPRTASEPIPAPDALARPFPADGDPHRLAGRRVLVSWSGLRGLESMIADGTPVLGAVRVAGATGANALVAPRAAVRECFLAGGAFRETILVPEALPGIVLQWGSSRTTGATVEIEVLPGPHGGDGIPAGFHRGAGLLWVTRGERGVLLHLPGTEARWDLREAAGRLLASARLDPGRETEAITLLAQSAPPGNRWTSGEALASVHAHHRRGEASSWGDDAGGMVLKTGVEEFDLGLRRSRAWLRDRLLVPAGRPPTLHPGDHRPLAALVARAAAATGDLEVGRAALASLEWSSLEAAIDSTRALTEWVAWTGGIQPLVSAREEILALLRGEALARTPRARVARLREGVVRAGEAAGDPELAAPRGPGEAGSSMALPVIGKGAVRSGTDEPEARAVRALEVRSQLGACARDPRTLESGAGLEALQGLAGDILGVLPDAPYGRLELSPLLPSHWTSFSVDGISVGEGSVNLSFERDGFLSRWVLRPREGSVPLTVVMEPWLESEGVAGVRVDGEEADLQTHVTRGWARVSVQLPVDRERVVEVEGRPS